jgi:hypothetical protein
MRILLTSAYPDPEPLRTLLRCATHARFHQLTDDPAIADAILFVEHSHYIQDPFFRKLRSHPWVRDYREKVFVYNEHDRPWCMLPGLYCAMPAQHFDTHRQAAVRYIRLLNPMVTDSHPAGEPEFLYSYIGHSHLRLRRRIVSLRHHPHALVEDSSAFNAFYATGIQQEHYHYADVMHRSKFILCPRGTGTSSIRLFETLKAGRVPVIIADDWVAPAGPDWASCSLRLRERDVAKLSDVIASREHAWSEMAAAARQTWIEWFADDVLFDRFGAALAQLLERRRIPERVAQRIPEWREYTWAARLAAHHARAAIRRAF